MQAYIWIPILEFILFTAAQIVLFGYWRNKLPNFVKNIHYGLDGQENGQTWKRSTTFTIALSLSIGLGIINFALSLLAREITTDFIVGFLLQLMILVLYAFTYKINKIDKIDNQKKNSQ